HTEVPEALVRLASKEDFRRATAWGLALRLCRKLSGGAEQVLDETGLRRMGNRLVLEMRGQTHVLVNPSVERNLSVLADWLGLDWTIEYSRANRRAG
ncbi:MAG: hypothetical protein N2423_01375, partial [Novosphingobium sp.]|nr:hypothetical protein [Novosphingobium sp.]